MEPPNSASAGRGEFESIERLADLLISHQGPPRQGEIWIGDDAAVLGIGQGPALFTTDLTVAGVHADPELMGAADIGWRAMVSAVSDIAAMGGRPAAAVVAVAGPADSDLDRLYDGIAEAAADLRCPVVGGDLSSAPVLTVAVTVLGSAGEGPPAVSRGGARPGDTILLTGPPGGAAAGLRILRKRRAAASAGEPADAPAVEAHLRPRARLAEGEIARMAGATAMIDVSDGLVADIGHIGAASGVGWELSGVPVFEGATLDEALGGGEDYELVLVTGDPGRLVEAFSAAGLRTPAVIGRCVADRSVRTVDGRPAPEAGGWEHPFAAVDHDQRGLH